MNKIKCIIDGINHIKIYNKCILCDKQWCNCSSTHKLANYEVISDNGSTRDFICNKELESYKKRNWKILNIIEVI